MDSASSSVTATEAPKVVFFNAGEARKARPVYDGKDAKQTFDCIPKVDISGIVSPQLEVRKQVADEIGKACKDVGFFYAVHPPLPKGLGAQSMEAVREFFALPMEEKCEVHFNNSSAFKGYEPLFETKHEIDGRGDMKESFSFANLRSPPVAEGDKMINQWPAGMPEFRTTLSSYYEAMRDLTKHLQRAFALFLGMTEDYFESLDSTPGNAVRCLHYPVQEAVDLPDVDIGPHTDYTWFTLVNQAPDANALQVLNGNAHWVSVPPIADSFVVNVGDLMQRASNDVLTSTVHRVMNMDNRDRYSIAFFHGPSKDVVVHTFPSCITEKNPQKYGPVKPSEHSQQRALASRYKHPLAHQK